MTNQRLPSNPAWPAAMLEGAFRRRFLEMYDEDTAFNIKLDTLYATFSDRPQLFMEDLWTQVVYGVDPTYRTAIRDMASECGLTRLTFGSGASGSAFGDKAYQPRGGDDLIHRWCALRYERESADLPDRPMFSEAQGGGGASAETLTTVSWAGSWDLEGESPAGARRRLTRTAAEAIEQQIRQATAAARASGFIFPAKPMYTSRDLGWLYRKVRGASWEQIITSDFDDDLVKQAVTRAAAKVGVDTKGWPL